MFSVGSFLRRKIQRVFNQGWNSCLEAVQKRLAEHHWVTEEDDPGEIFCDICGQSFARLLEEMRR